MFSVIHGIIRTTRTTGQTFPKIGVSAPMQIGAKGGIIVEGVENNVIAGGVTVTDTNVLLVSVEIMAANINRNFNTFQNNGLNTVYLAFDAAAVAGSGFELDPGAVWEPTSIFQGQVFAIAAAGTNRVTVLEG